MARIGSRGGGNLDNWTGMKMPRNVVYYSAASLAPFRPSAKKRERERETPFDKLEVGFYGGDRFPAAHPGAAECVHKRGKFHIPAKKTMPPGKSSRSRLHIPAFIFPPKYSRPQLCSRPHAKHSRPFFPASQLIYIPAHTFFSPACPPFKSCPLSVLYLPCPPLSSISVC